MEGLLGLARWLEETPMGASVRQSLWLFPAIETVHLLGMATLLATIGAFDLRLIGLILRGERLSGVARRVLPWAWAGFALQVITGALLFSSEAVHMVRNPAFRVKMALIVVAGAQALVFQWMARRRMAGWDVEAKPRTGLRIAGAASLALWIAVVAAGRWIGFI
jgi:hypothetical protein